MHVISRTISTSKVIYCVMDMCACYDRESRSDSGQLDPCFNESVLQAKIFTRSVRYPTYFSTCMAYHTASALRKPFIVSRTCVHAMTENPGQFQVKSIRASMNCMIRAWLFTRPVRYPTHFSRCMSYRAPSLLPKPCTVS